MGDASIRDPWMHSVVSASQRLAGTLATSGVDDAPAIVRAFAAGLPPAPDGIHRMILGSMLLDTALHVARHVHRAVDSGRACPCRSLEPAAARITTRALDTDPREVFTGWMAEFFEAFADAHHQTVAIRAAQVIRRKPSARWTLADVAQAVRTSPRLLSRQFARHYGMSTKTYLHLARLDVVLRDLDSPNTKIYVVAHEAGYRSKKDLYRTTVRLLGVTVAGYRRLPVADRQCVRDAIRRRLLLGDR